MAKIMDEKALSSDLPFSTAPSGVGQGDAGQAGGAVVGLLEAGTSGGDLKKNNAGEGPKVGDAGEGDAGGDIVNDRAAGGANDGILAAGCHNEVEAPEASNGDAGQGNVNQSIEEVVYARDEAGAWGGRYSEANTRANGGQGTSGVRFGDCHNSRAARGGNTARNYDQGNVAAGSGDGNWTHVQRTYSRYGGYGAFSDGSDDDISEYLYGNEENVERRPYNPREGTAREQTWTWIGLRRPSAMVGCLGRMRGRPRGCGMADATPKVNKKRFGIRL